MMMKLFDKSSQLEENSNDQLTHSFKFESESKSNGFSVEFKKINTNAIKMVFITYSETGESITCTSLVAKMNQEILDDVAKAASDGYDSFMHNLKNFNTSDDRVRDFIKWGVWDVEKAFMKQNSSRGLELP